MTGLTVAVPVSGSLLIRFDGSDELHEVGKFEQEIPVTFDGRPGHATVKFNKENA